MAVKIFLGKPPAHIENWIKNNNVSEFKFGVLSDIHITTEADSEENYGGTDDFIAALRMFKSFDIKNISMCGDITTDHSDERMAKFKTTWQETFPTATIRSCVGNHDSALTDAKWNEYLGTSKNYAEIINNVAFIYFSPSERCDAIQSSPYTDADVQWLQQKLNLYAANKVMVFMHFPFMEKAGLLTGQRYGFDRNSTQSSQIYNMLVNHGDCVAFSGHTHIEFGVESTSSTYVNYSCDGGVACVHVPSLTRPRDWNHQPIAVGSPDLQPRQGYIVRIVNDSVYIEAMDIRLQTKIDLYSHIIGESGCGCGDSEGIRIYNSTGIDSKISIRLPGEGSDREVDFVVGDGLNTIPFSKSPCILKIYGNTDVCFAYSEDVSDGCGGIIHEYRENVSEFTYIKGVTTLIAITLYQGCDDPGCGCGCGDGCDDPGCGCGDGCDDPGCGCGDGCDDPGCGCGDGCDDPGCGCGDGCDDPGCGCDDPGCGCDDPGCGCGDGCDYGYDDPGCGCDDSGCGCG